LLPSPLPESLTRRTTWLLAALAAFLVVGCAGTLIPRISSTDAARAGTTTERLEEGRQIYVAKCTGCHAPLAPSALTAADWRREVHAMVDEANIDPESTELVIDFLVAFSRDAERGAQTVAESGPIAAPRESAHP
jgi:hypothetical protein